MKKIFIAVPNTGGIVPELTTALIYWTHQKDYRVMTFFPEGIFPLDAARNKCVLQFLKTDCDLLWWIDSDIVPPPHTMDRLAQADKDIIGAVCFSMRRDDNGKYFPYPVTLKYNEDRKYAVYYDGKGVEQVDATGGACVMFKREVFEAIEKPYEFLYYPDGTLRLTCDFHIYQKTEKLGFKLWIDFGILCDHQRSCSIKGMQDFLANELHKVMNE